MTYAIVKHGGKQYKVSEGEEILVDRLEGDAGTKVEIESVLLLASENGVKVGTPVVEGASIEAEIVNHERGDKLIVFKMKRRKGYRRKTGHRQDFTRLRVVKVNG